VSVVPTAGRNLETTSDAVKREETGTTLANTQEISDQLIASLEETTKA
jgi:hypothetical protein